MKRRVLKLIAFGEDYRKLCGSYRKEIPAFFSDKNNTNTVFFKEGVGYLSTADHGLIKLKPHGRLLNTWVSKNNIKVTCKNNKGILTTWE